MPFVPKFILNLEQFRKERDSVRNIDDWRAFEKKWLDEIEGKTCPWKTAEVLKKEGEKKLGPVLIGERLWGYTTFNADISPEARYEYFFTLRTVGAPLKFPEENGISKSAAQGFYQECPYCEIWTDQIGENVCPKCKRQLIWGRSAD